MNDNLLFSRTSQKCLLILAMIYSYAIEADTKNIIEIGNINHHQAYITYEISQLSNDGIDRSSDVPLCQVYSHDTIRDSANNGANISFWKVTISLRNDGVNTLVFSDVPSASFRLNVEELFLNCSNASEISRRISEIDSNILTKDYTYEFNILNLPKASTHEKSFNFATIGNSPPIVTVNRISKAEFEEPGEETGFLTYIDESGHEASAIISNALVEFKNFEEEKQREEQRRARELLIEQQRQIEEQKKREAELAEAKRRQQQEKQSKQDDLFGKALALTMGAALIGMAKDVPSEVKTEVGAALAADVLMDTGGSNLLKGTSINRPFQV